MLNQPLYCITSDIDWASEYCIENFLELTDSFGIKPTLFTTHHSPAVEQYNAANPDCVGVHPNFLNGSTHGSDYLSVIDHVFKLCPNAKSFRSHCFFDNSMIHTEMFKRGIKYDSNLCLYLQPHLIPLQLSTASIIRFPVFWEDDDHWHNTGGDWEFKHYREAFLSPGLKIINVHPFFITANIPNEQHYEKIKQYIPGLSCKDINKVQWQGLGARTFFIELIEFLMSRQERFYTLHELYEMLPIESFLVSKSHHEGRETIHTDQDYQRYWQMSDSDKQNFIKTSYTSRNKEDIYATSRDFHARELEIKAIMQGLGDKGPVVDIGCGNGYTLISLSKMLSDWDLTGVDFSENLIEGAHHLVEAEKKELQSQPKFICEDAIHYIENLQEQSVAYFITERFIQNLPSVEWQKKVVRQVHRVLQKQGRFLMCEGSRNGFIALNHIREEMGLPVIHETSADNVSAIRFDDQEFEDFLCNEIGFKIVKKLGFSKYFIIARVVHPLLVAPLTPRFDAKLNELARLIQEKTEFEPGYGSNVVWVLEK